MECTAEVNEFSYWWIFFASALLGFSAWMIMVIYWERRLPPGPWGLPFIGQLWYLNRRNALEQLLRWKEKYGRIFSYSIGDFRVVVLNDLATMMEALRRPDFTARPDFEVWKVRNNGERNRGILFSDAYAGPWTADRDFTHQCLKKFDFGEQSMQEVLQTELKVLVHQIEVERIAANNSALYLESTLNTSVFNVLWVIVTGQRFEVDNAWFHHMLGKLKGHLKRLSLAAPMMFFPVLSKWTWTEVASDWGRLTLMYEDVKEMADGIISQHFGSYNRSLRPKDLTDAFYKHKMQSWTGPMQPDQIRELRQTLRIVIMDLFSAGNETTSTVLLWAILYMTKFPEVQRKLREEIDLHVGNRLPTLADKKKLVYLKAFIHETLRKSSVNPMGVYHAATKDTSFEEYQLPKGTLIFLNFYAANHNIDSWDQPELFRPERFLNSGRTKFQNHPHFIPFSMGDRKCIGQNLAMNILFMFLTGLIQKFTFELHNPKEVDPFKLQDMFVASPDPFRVTVLPR